MRILVVAPDDAYSRVNFIEEFRRMGHEVIHFDFTRRLLDYVSLETAAAGCDLLFHVLVNDEISGDVLNRLEAVHPEIATLQYACDDEWRLPVALRTAAHYDICTTNDPNAVPLYRAKGIDQVLHIQYGVAPSAWTATGDVVQDLDVSFVGQNYIGRGVFLDRLRERGIQVGAWGQGFEGGQVEHAEMLSILRRSKIVLGLNWVAGGPEGGYGAQIKGRIFEAAALGCFQLVTYDRRLTRYFAPGEIATYTDVDNCVQQIRHFLDHPEQRKALALAGQERALRDHTWARRWSQALPGLFKEIAVAQP